ncbi:MAG: S8 family peptidase [Spirochaetes bacterium]|nr:S8 family peptidase [Spirochaetota bacterium]
MDNTIQLPVRVVQPSRDFLHKDTRSGGDIKFFLNESEMKEHCSKLIGEIKLLEEDLQKSFDIHSVTPNVIKAKMREKALAKSHRPNNLLDKDTCPIIGVENFGELLLSTTQAGLEKLKKKLKEPTSIKIKANITAIEKIEPFGINEKLLGLSPKKLEEFSMRGGTSYLKVILFDHQDDEINLTTTEEFKEWVKDLGLKIELVSNLKNIKILKIIGGNEELIETIGNHPAVRTLSFFPTYKIIKPKTINTKIENRSFPLPEKNQEYARVGIIDTGIPKDHPVLQPWVIEHISFVHDKYANEYHGSFVGGLTSFGHHLNGASICPDQEPINLVDVQVLGNGNPQYGEIDEIPEDILMVRLEESVPHLTVKHNIKIWNMSAGLSVMCEQDRFSNLAIFLDELQDECGIIFTLPSGNVVTETGEQRTWPPQEEIDFEDHLEAPGDSIRAITVGAIACNGKPDSCVQINEPTSYSRKGPGPSYTIKPDLVHYSGNNSCHNPGRIDLSGQGILSVDEKGRIVEDAGTSFSSPLAARTLGLLHNSLLQEPSPNLMKALAIHSCYLPKELGALDKIMPYVGFGLPSSLKTIFSCSENEITLIFEQEIIQGFTLDYPFNWPPSLIDYEGKCRGNIKMTLVAEPPLDSNFGAEYIRANVSAMFQFGKQTDDGKMKWSNKVNENPTTGDLKKQFETELVEHGYKWKPIKKYEAIIKRIKAEDWRIRLRLLLRDGSDLGLKPIKFALVVTISDPEKTAPVYNEVVNGLRQRNVITNEIQLRSQIRQRIESKY